MLINRALQNSPTMQAARLRISQSQSTVELARSAMGLQATAVAAQNRLRITDKSFSWPYSYSLPVDKTAPVYAEYRWRRGAAEYRSLGAERARVAAAIGEKTPGWRRPPALSSTSPAAWRSSISPCRRRSRKIALLQELEGIARFSVEAHEHRTRRGWKTVWMWPTPAEQLAARQQIISAEGMLTQYRETLRALIGADAQSMPAIHPVALPALRDAAAVALFRAAGPPSGPAALRGYVTASLSRRCGESGLLSPF